MTSNHQGLSELTDVGAFGAALRRHRRNLDLSQEELADATHGGVAARTISDLERGVARRPRAETVRLLAAALRLTGAEVAEFKAAARAANRRAATSATDETAALAAPAGLAAASRRTSTRPLIIVADATRLAEVQSLLSTTADCLVLVTGGGPLPGQDGADARIVPLTAMVASGPGMLRQELPA
jgi:transcriptional regulator with XRE-family HTH domain